MYLELISDFPDNLVHPEIMLVLVEDGHAVDSDNEHTMFAQVQSYPVYLALK